MVKPVIDATRCMGAGFCVQIAPHIFEIDPETGKSRVLVNELDEADREAADEAETMCPMIAVSVAG